MASLNKVQLIGNLGNAPRSSLFPGWQSHCDGQPGDERPLEGQAERRVARALGMAQRGVRRPGGGHG